ncbi:MAG: protein translocase subunit SecD [Candidatus Zambryskibacteria bacterium]|nr:protein translocase subunit SecD [Candidatus Zambryskibacteria bacterium]
MFKYRIWSVFLIIIIAGLGFFAYDSQVNPKSYFAKYKFTLGLDLNGGTELVYRADVSKIPASEIGGAMSSLRDVIERRVNVFGVSEPIIQVEEAGLVSGQKDHRLIVELPGVADVEQAIKLLGETPRLEFMLLRPEAKGLTEAELATKTVDEVFMPTGITGALLSKATLEFSQSNQGIAGKPTVGLSFNAEGRDLFAKVTRENKGQVLAIFLDGSVISSPVINEEISDGKAVISGSFTREEAKALVRNLNYGALPVPIELLSTQTVGPSLGVNAQQAGVKAGVVGFIILTLFLVLYYRLPGFVSVVSLLMYIVVSLLLFKLIPVTLTAAGIAGFILSIGMAVDANVLIFERFKEELKKGNTISDAMTLGFSRAWLSIRDSNISSMITAGVLFWLGTSAVKGFALTFGIGVLVSMFTAITVSRTFLATISPKTDSGFKRFLFSNGFHIR